MINDKEILILIVFATLVMKLEIRIVVSLKKLN